MAKAVAGPSAAISSGLDVIQGGVKVVPPRRSANPISLAQKKQDAEDVKLIHETLKNCPDRISIEELKEELGI
jgi:hypothetical protein